MSETTTDAGTKEALADVFRDFSGDNLRDIWLFDQSEYESVYIRDDVATKLDDIDVPKYIENERYGFITRDTYSLLYYADYQYTVRGFNEFEQFRMFLTEEGDQKVGVLSSMDQRADGYDFHVLYDRLADLVANRSDETFIPG